MAIDKLISGMVTNKHELEQKGYEDTFQYFSDYRIYKKDNYLLLLEEDLKDRNKVRIEYIINKKVEK